MGRHAHAGLCAKLELDSTFRDGDIAKAALVLWPTIERLLELGDEERCDRREAVDERNGRVGCPERVSHPGAIMLTDCAAEGDRVVLAELAAISAGGVLGQVGLDAALAQRCLQPGQHHRPFPDQQDAIRHGGCASHRCLIGVALEARGVFTVDPLSRAA